MSRYYAVSDDDHQPLTWVQGRPLYAAHVIVAALVATLLATTLLMAMGARGFLDALRFHSADVLSGQPWRVLTYGLVNPPSLWFVIDMVLLVWFGREVERVLGRRSFLKLYAFLYLIPPLLFTVIGIWAPQTFSGQTGAFAIFVAFATLHPGATLLFNLLAGWVAGVLVALYSLVALAARDWTGLIALWSTTGYAFAFVRHSQGRLWLPLPRLPGFQRDPLRDFPEHIGPRHPPAPRSAPARTRSAAQVEMDEVDALLDKINRSGLESLTLAEQQRLQAAQARLARRYERSAASGT
jgi:membrane associated rhomboid family serine protease